MKIFSKEEWARNQYRGQWEASRWNLDRVAAGELPAGYIGRRYAMVEGCKLITEGVHFLVEGDYSHLPVLNKENAMEGACYQFAGGYIQVIRLYRLSEAEALEHDLYGLDRADYIQHTDDGMYPGGCALPGGDMRKS